MKKIVRNVAMLVVFYFFTVLSGSEVFISGHASTEPCLFVDLDADVVVCGR